MLPWSSTLSSHALESHNRIHYVALLTIVHLHAVYENLLSAQTPDAIRKVEMCRCQTIYKARRPPPKSHSQTSQLFVKG